MPPARQFPPERQPNPHLPLPTGGMTWRDLRGHGQRRDGKFYVTALRYGNHLWLAGYSARSILALNRALYADLSGGEPELAEWPLPYKALRWVLLNHDGEGFLGNPRISYQHFADRVRGERREQKSWRAWACWWIARHALPELEGDPRHAVEEPTPGRIEKELQRHGVRGEVEMWRSAWRDASPE